MKISLFIFSFILLIIHVSASPELRNYHFSKKFQSFLDLFSSPKGFLETKSNILFPLFEKFLEIELSAKQNNQSFIENAFKNYVKGEKLFDSWTCTGCKSFIKSLQQYDNSTLILYIEKFIVLVCSTFLDHNVCAGAINEYASNFVKNFAKKILDPVIVCAKLHFCPNTYVPLDFEDYKKGVLADKPEVKIPIPTKKSSVKVLHLADAHIDFEYEEGYNAFCTEPFCCRAENGMPSSPDQAAQYWGTLAGCDVPLRTAEQAFLFMADLKPDIILWTGDNISHDVWHQNITNQTKPTKYLTNLFKKHLKNVPLYPIFGNHECFPADQFDIFLTDSNAWLKNETSQLWAEYLDTQALNSLKKNGFYSIYNPSLNLKVLVLNTQTCDSINFFLLRNPTDPDDILSWMRAELYEAEKNNKNVYIIGHIPPGESFCVYEWGQRYNVLIDRFQNIVRGQFFGHTHQDHFETMRSQVDNSVIGTVYIAPSLTTYTAQNPSIRLFEVDKETMLPTNIYQYRLNLTKVNSEKNSTRIYWDLAYDFLNEYNVTDLSWESLSKISDSLDSNFELRKKFIYHYYAGGDFGKLTDEQINSTYYKRYFSCRPKNSIFLNYVKCMGYEILQAQTDLLFVFLQWLDGEWFLIRNENPKAEIE